MLEGVVHCVACIFQWESICEHSEHEGESLVALPVEGATQAPVIDPRSAFNASQQNDIGVL